MIYTEEDSNRQAVIFVEVSEERRRQDGRWGKPAERNLPLPIWLTVLAEEVGEVAHEILVGAKHDDYTALRAELVQVAAVAIAMIEAIDGESAPWGITEGDAG